MIIRKLALLHTSSYDIRTEDRSNVLIQTLGEHGWIPASLVSNNPEQARVAMSVEGDRGGFVISIKYIFLSSSLSRYLMTKSR